LESGYWLHFPLFFVAIGSEVAPVGRGLKIERNEKERKAWRSDESSRNNVTQSIVNVLKEMWHQRHEIPFIACFRKEASTKLVPFHDESLRSPGFTWILPVALSLTSRPLTIAAS
jgi:hypothetical protein